MVLCIKGWGQNGHQLTSYIQMQFKFIHYIFAFNSFRFSHRTIFIYLIYRDAEIVVGKHISTSTFFLLYVRFPMFSFYFIPDTLHMWIRWLSLSDLWVWKRMIRKGKNNVDQLGKARLPSTLNSGENGTHFDFQPLIECLSV